MTNTEIDAVIAGLSGEQRDWLAHDTRPLKAFNRRRVHAALVHKGLIVASGQYTFTGSEVRERLLTNQPETK